MTGTTASSHWRIGGWISGNKITEYYQLSRRDPSKISHQVENFPSAHLASIDRRMSYLVLLFVALIAIFVLLTAFPRIVHCFTLRLLLYLAVSLLLGLVCANAYFSCLFTAPPIVLMVLFPYMRSHRSPSSLIRSLLSCGISSWVNSYIVCFLYKHARHPRLFHQSFGTGNWDPSSFAWIVVSLRNLPKPTTYSWLGVITGHSSIVSIKANPA